MMKRLLSLFLVWMMLVTMLPVTAMPTFAAPVTDGRYTVDGNVLTGITAEALDADGHLVIPATVTDDETGKAVTVTTVASYAPEASMRETIRTITIEAGSSITAIENNAFENLEALEAVDLTGLSQNAKLGKWVFKNCNHLKTILLPEAIGNIGDGVFQACTSLERVTVLNDQMTFGTNESGTDTTMFSSTTQAINLYSTAPSTAKVFADQFDNVIFIDLNGGSSDPVSNNDSKTESDDDGDEASDDIREKDIDTDADNEAEASDTNVKSDEDVGKDADNGTETEDRTKPDAENDTKLGEDIEEDAGKDVNDGTEAEDRTKPDAEDDAKLGGDIEEDAGKDANDGTEVEDHTKPDAENDSKSGEDSGENDDSGLSDDNEMYRVLNVSADEGTRSAVSTSATNAQYTVEDNVLTVIKASALDGDGNLVIPSTVTDAETGNVATVTTVKSYAPEESIRDAVKTIKLESNSSIVSIESNAFKSLTALETVDLTGLAENATLGNWVFRSCIGLKTVILPETVNSIGRGVYYFCTSL
ncbi:leucine-rich repeat protein, partial [Fusibacter paucivorans]